MVLPSAVLPEQPTDAAAETELDPARLEALMMGHDVPPPASAPPMDVHEPEPAVPPSAPAPGKPITIQVGEVHERDVDSSATPPAPPAPRAPARVSKCVCGCVEQSGPLAQIPRSALVILYTRRGRLEAGIAVSGSSTARHSALTFSVCGQCQHGFASRVHRSAAAVWRGAGEAKFQLAHHLRLLAECARAVVRPEDELDEL